MFHPKGPKRRRSWITAWKKQRLKHKPWYQQRVRILWMVSGWMCFFEKSTSRKKQKDFTVMVESFILKVTLYKRAMMSYVNQNISMVSQKYWKIGWSHAVGSHAVGKCISGNILWEGLRYQSNDTISKPGTLSINSLWNDILSANKWILMISQVFKWFSDFSGLAFAYYHKVTVAFLVTGWPEKIAEQIQLRSVWMPNRRCKHWRTPFQKRGVKLKGSKG